MDVVSVSRYRIARASSRDCNGNEQQRFSQIDDASKPCIERKWDQVTIVDGVLNEVMAHRIVPRSIAVEHAEYRSHTCAVSPVDGVCLAEFVG